MEDIQSVETYQENIEDISVFEVEKQENLPDEDIEMIQEDIIEDYPVVDYEKIEYLEPDQIIKGEEIKNEDKLNKDLTVSGSDGINDISNIKSINIDNIDLIFEKTNLYTFTGTSQSSGTITLNDDLYKYDYILIQIKSSYTDNYYINQIISVDDFKWSNTNVAGGAKPGSVCAVNSLTGGTNTTNRYYRYLYGMTSESKIGMYTNNAAYNLVTEIYGLKRKEISNNEQEIVSGNIVNNYYVYCTVSDNSVSNNIIDKPINEYNTQEGLLFLIFVGFLSVVLFHAIRKGIFRWN